MDSDASQQQQHEERKASKHVQVQQRSTVLIRFHDTRIMIVVAALTMLILPLMFFGWHDVVIGTGRTDTLTATEREEKAKTYNFWTGLVVASLSKPIEVMLTMLLVVVVLGICAQQPLDVRSASVKHSLLAINAGILMMVTSGLSSLNVQHREIENNPQFIGEDLVGYAPVNGSLHKRFDGFANRSFSLENSILRTAFDSTNDADEQSSSCNDGVTFEMPTVAYGFRPRPWMREMVADEVKMTRTPLNVADLLRREAEHDDLQNRMVRKYNQGSKFLRKKGASAERLVFNLSADFSFEALVVDFPSTLNISDKGNRTHKRLATDRCGRNVCLVAIDDVNADLKPPTSNSQDFLSAFRKPWMWIPSEDGLNETSLIVSAAGSRIAGRRMGNVNTDIPAAELNDGIKYFTLMMGRLSWRSINLAKTFNASCAPGLDCTGLAFPLQRNESKVVVLGATELLRLREDVHLVNFQSKQHFDVVFSDNVDENVLQLDASKCNKYAEKYAQFVESNHMYMEDPVQTSYMAALFYVFQNAALRESIVVETTSGPQRTLKLKGNDRAVEFYIVTPALSAILSIVGCTVIILTVTFTLHANNSRRVSDEHHLDHASVVYTLLKSDNSAQHLVECHGDDVTKFVTLAAFEVDQVQLVHNTVGKVVLCGQGSQHDDHDAEATGA